MTKIWCDFIERSFIESEFKELVKSEKICGATSNPSIFALALKSVSYNEELEGLRSQDLSANEIYEYLALQDIRSVAKILQPLYEKDSRDGLVSLEINPLLCEDVEQSINEGVRLWRELECKNAMIKVPATQSGYEIIENLMLRKINVNATLVFSKEQARGVLDAFKRADTGVQGVISVFVSRFDRELDSKLPLDLRGKCGIANAIEIYNDFKANNESENYRILFASTGVKEKNETYKDDGYYVYPLGFEDCINTLPLETLRSIDYSKLEDSANSFDSKDILNRLEEFGIKLESVQQKLLKNGLKAFEMSYTEMVENIVIK